MPMTTILCTVTNDLVFDQRMQRICSTLAGHGYAVELIGRVLPHSPALDEQPYAQRRLRCRFTKGVLFYAEFNLRLFFYLLRAPCDAICSVDLDTLPAGCAASLLRRKKRVFDAHEYFTEVPEVTHRPLVKWVWAAVARLCLPFYRHAYTVGPALAGIMQEKYKLPFAVVRNVPSLSAAPAEQVADPVAKILLYQGALNAGRGIEHMLAAMQSLDGLELWLAGEGDLSEALRQRAAALGLGQQVKFLGRVNPAGLQDLTRQAWLGINVLENKGLSYYYSLANKFFDYVHAGVPVLTMDFPEYRALNTQHEVAVLLDHLTPEKIVAAIRLLQTGQAVYDRLQRNTRAARLAWNWDQEQSVLLQTWAAALEVPAKKA